MTGRLHRGKRSKESKEQRLARMVAFENSFKTRDPDEIQETIFTSTPDKLVGEVLARLKGEREEEVPECPQGLVLTNHYGLGFFDVNV
jgi:hypothetical protein